jgi:hypothetical protein
VCGRFYKVQQLMTLPQCSSFEKNKSTSVFLRFMTRSF